MRFTFNPFLTPLFAEAAAPWAVPLMVGLYLLPVAALLVIAGFVVMLRGAIKAPQGSRAPLIGALLIVAGILLVPICLFTTCLVAR